MTIKQLINRLSELDENTQVLLHNYGDLTDIKAVSIQKVWQVNLNKPNNEWEYEAVIIS